MYINTKQNIKGGIRIDRRSFNEKIGLGIGSAVSTTAFAAPVIAQNSRKLTMVTTSWRGLAGVFDAAQRVADNVNAMSDGSLEIDVKAAGELMGAFEVFDAVSSGQVDMYHGADYYFIGKHPGFVFFTGVPFGMTATEHNNWWYHMGGRELGDELGKMFNLKTFLAGNTTTQAGGWFHFPIKSVKDLEGLKLRMLGLGGEAMRKLGVSIQNIPGTEINKAFSSKEIDGVQWVGPWADEKAGFQKIVKMYYGAGFHEPSVAFSCATNREVFDDLSLRHQKIIEIACAEANIWNMTLFLANNSIALQRLVATGVIVSQFPDSVWEAFGEASRKVIEEFKKDEMFMKIYDSYTNSMQKSANWISQSTSIFQAQRNRVFGLST